ncbi:hypothetical protein ABT010_13210 [Streptomyces sp. NPDC002668]|uniref:hypothetical protein n=1 Tax=Streptomyces sp. NPDC002668 TaxID=3154422 RepID=UPI0033175778
MSINHRAEAEKHLANAAHHLTEHPGDMRIAEVAAWIGQGHANLVRDEELNATFVDLRDANTLLRRREYALRELVSAHIAKALASRERDRWKAGLDLTKALDEADCNMDGFIDNRLSDDGWDPRSAWKAPASAVPGTGAPARDPWTPAPDITAEIPEPVRRVLAEHLADMLLTRDDDAITIRARNLAFALKNEGADLTEAIRTRISDTTLGRDPSEPPF